LSLASLARPPARPAGALETERRRCAASGPEAGSRRRDTQSRQHARPKRRRGPASLRSLRSLRDRASRAGKGRARPAMHGGGAKRSEGPVTALACPVR